MTLKSIVTALTVTRQPIGASRLASFATQPLAITMVVPVVEEERQTTPNVACATTFTAITNTISAAFTYDNSCPVAAAAANATIAIIIANNSARLRANNCAVATATATIYGAIATTAATAIYRAITAAAWRDSPDTTATATA